MKFDLYFYCILLIEKNFFLILIFFRVFLVKERKKKFCKYKVKGFLLKC